MNKYFTIAERLKVIPKSDSAIPLILRWFILAGILLRPFTIAKSTHRVWFFLAGALFIYTVVVTIAATNTRNWWQSRRWNFLQIIFDTVFISLFYSLTRDPNSAFFLFYALPLLIAGEYLSVRDVTISFFVITGFFLLSSGVIRWSNPTVSVDISLRYFLMRWSYFLFVIYVIFIRSSLFKLKDYELKAMRRTAVSIARQEALDLRLEAIMDSAMEILSALGCSIYLLKPEERVAEVVGVKGVESDLFKPGFTLRYDQGLVGEVISSGKGVIENDYKAFWKAVPELEPLFEAVIEYPLHFDHEITGIIAVYGRKHHFSPRHFLPLDLLAQQAAVAIHDIQTVERTKRQAEVLRILNQASKEMTENLDLIETGKAVAENLNRLAQCFNQEPALYACVALLSENRRTLKVFGCFPERIQERLKERVAQIDLQAKPRGIIGRVITEDKAELVPNVKVDNDYIEVLPEANTEIAVPIKGRNAVIGIINIEHESVNAYSKELLAHVEAMAAQAGTALENDSLFQQNEAARLAGDEQRRAEEALRKASLKISSVRGVNAVAQSILDNLNLIIPHDRSTLQLLKEDRRLLLAKRNLRENELNRSLLKPLSEDKLVSHIVSTREIYSILATDKNPLWENFKETQKVKSWTGVPLTYADQVIGLITIDYFQPCRLSERQNNLLRLFSSHAASVLQNAMLIQENEKRIDELSEIKDKLETYIEHTEAHHTLANIGLVFGESIHFAANRLGMAKTLAANILQQHYQDENKLKSSAEKIIFYINQYLEVLEDIQKQVILPPNRQIDLHSTLDETIASKRISDEIQISRNFGAKHCRIWVLDRQLRQVFLVVLQNAISAMNGEGKLTVTTNDELINGNKFLTVVITDTGSGIPKREQADLFKAKPITVGRRGVKLGLPWAYSFLRIYGGSLSFTTSDQGTSITISFPADWRAARKI